MMNDVTVFSPRLKAAVLFVTLCFLYLFAVTFLPLSATGEDQAKTITPFLLGSVVGTLIGFYYGNKHEDKKEPPDTTNTTTETTQKVITVEATVQPEKVEATDVKPTV